LRPPVERGGAARISDRKLSSVIFVWRRGFRQTILCGLDITAARAASMFATAIALTTTNGVRIENAEYADV
jgi:hypothetical protein